MLLHTSYIYFVIVMAWVLILIREIMFGFWAFLIYQRKTGTLIATVSCDHPQGLTFFIIFTQPERTVSCTMYSLAQTKC